MTPTKPPHGFAATVEIIRHRATQPTIEKVEQAVCLLCLPLRRYLDASAVAWFATAVEGLRGIDAESLEILPDPFAGGVPVGVRAAAIEARRLLHRLHLDLRAAGVPVDVESAAQRALLLQLAILEVDWHRPAAEIARDFHPGLPWVVSADGRTLTPDDGVAGQVERDAAIWRRRYREAVLAGEGQGAHLRAPYGGGEGRAKPTADRVEAVRRVLASRPDWADLTADDFGCAAGSRLTPPAEKLQEFRKDLGLPRWYKADYMPKGKARQAIGDDLRAIRTSKIAGEFCQIPSTADLGTVDV